MSRTRQRLMPDSEHRRADIDVAYRAMHFAVEQILKCGTSVIVESTYGRREQRRELEDVTASASAALFLVECQVPSDLAVARFKARPPGHPAIDLTASRVALLAERYPYRRSGLLLDTRASIPACLTAIQTYLGEGKPIPRGEGADSGPGQGSWPGPYP